MKVTTQRHGLVLLTALLSGCAIEPINESLTTIQSGPLPSDLELGDLRAEKWKSTHFVPNVRGAVQHFGDDAVPGGLPRHIASQLLGQLQTKIPKRMVFKTIDLRVSIPDLTIPAMGKHTMNADQANYILTAKSSITSVICVAVDGSDYLGDFGTLARFGLKEELRQAIDKSVSKLAANVRAGQTSASPACEPGWEGGQSR